MTSQNRSAIRPGLAILQSNRMDDLKSILLEWLRAHPLPPFETETILVQSNGMAQWLKLGLASDKGLGISAGVQIMLPSTFLWGVYRKVLGEAKIPASSPLDLEPMTWRIFGLLADVIRSEDDTFASLKAFLEEDPRQERRYQLAGQIAGLFDQYQVYRPDWLEAWGNNQIARDIDLPEDLKWQEVFWRTLIEPLQDGGQSTSRAYLNDQLLTRLEELSTKEMPLPKGLPRRLVIFGISSLPGQTLDAIKALSRKIQILYFVQNPCQHYWADILDAQEAAQEALRFRLKRHKIRSDLVAPVPESLHLEGNPLLAAWGKQGRDFVRLLDHLDSPTDYQNWFQKIDVFDEVPEERARLLHQIQNAILNRDPLPQKPSDRKRLLWNEDSISFHVAHTRQREVEALHDQLLKLFDRQDGTKNRLLPKDIIVMMPDVDRYAPHIEAVFGQIPVEDPRYIPFSIADRRRRGHHPIHLALEYLLNLPDARLTASEVLDLLDVDPIRRRFELNDSDIALLKRWIMDSGIRWGLDAQHRGPLDPALNFDQNTWKSGLQRMALGYCMGDVRSTEDITPLSDIGGIEGDRLGPLWLFVETLSQYQRDLSEPATPEVWGNRLSNLLGAFFKPGNKEDQQSIERLEACLRQWQTHCEEARITDPVHLAVVREAWLASLDTPNLTQRFLAGRVNFCTLMPMRSIPFSVVCLLGMNDAEFPRIQPRRVFDLMSLPGAYRPGDRSRRDDDRYMFLEALLSAKDKLIVSWVGRNVRDDSELPPSVLVSQLRDYIEAGWVLATEKSDQTKSLLDHLTLKHGLQPFSPLYFTGKTPHYSYAREWRTVLQEKGPRTPLNAEQSLASPEYHEPLTLLKLERLLKDPSQIFFEQRLGVHFEDQERTAEDLETFELNHLQRHIMGNDMVKAALRSPGMSTPDLDAASRHLRLAGELPFKGFGDIALTELESNAINISEQFDALLKKEGWNRETIAPIPLVLAPFKADGSASLVLEDWLTDLRIRENHPSEQARIEFRPGAILDDGKPKRHSLVGLWVRHVAASAMGCSLTSYLIAADVTLRLAPLSETDARAWLESMVMGWRSGLNYPLPVALKTSLAWLDAKPENQTDEAIKAYEGDDYFSRGEVKTSEYLNRAYPTAEYLLSGRSGEAGFPDWTQRLYQPLHDAAFEIEVNL